MKMNSFVLILSILLLGAECRQLVDLTHTLDNNAPKWPLYGILAEEDYFKKTDLIWARTEYYWAAISYMEYYEHMGTHIDAPIHTSEGKSTVDQIPVDNLMRPGVVFDIKGKAKQNSDYALTIDDIEDFENQFGRIPDGAIAILNSGWGLKYREADQMFGTDVLNDTSTFHFPGFSIEAAIFLYTQRGLRVLGTDTPSLDVGVDPTLPVHVYLQSREIPLLEYVSNLDSIPQAGTTIFLGAPKFRGGTWGPTRVIAVLDDDSYPSSAAECPHGTLIVLLICCIFNTFR